MRILKIKGKNQEVIQEQIKKEYGDLAVILRAQQEKRSGFFKWFKSSKTVVTVAVKDEEDQTSDFLNQAPASQDKDMEQVTYNVLLSLKEQIEEMQHSITGLSNTKIEDKRESDSGNKVMDILKSKLQNEGINQEILDSILEGIDEESDVETIIRVLYANIEALLQKELHTKSLPKIVFFIGPTGVGKTTTIAKLTADYVLNKHKKVVLFTSDTYRIAAIEQLRTYADILGVDIEIIYDEKELLNAIKKWDKADHIFIDTAGRSHKNTEQIKDIKGLLQSVDEKQVFLVLNANTSAKDVKNIISIYESFYEDFELIITKLDETDEIGNVINIAYYAKRPILYLTHGQNVPADIKGFNADEYTSYLLGRLNYE